MLVSRLRGVVRVDIGESIYPYDVQVLELLQAGQNSGTRDGVITAQSKGLRELVASLVKLQVSCS